MWRIVETGWMELSYTILYFLISLKIFHNKMRDKNVAQCHSASVLVIYCCITNYPKPQQLKTTLVYYLSFWGSGSGHRWAECPWFRVFYEVTMLPRAVVISGLSWSGRDPSWSSCTSGSLTVGGNIRSLTHGLLQCATHSMAAASSKVKESECPRWKSQPFPHLILEVASHHFYCILFIKISQLSLVHSPGQGGVTQWHEYQEVGIRGLSSRLLTTANKEPH